MEESLNILGVSKGVPLKDVPMLSESERQQLLTGWNQTKVEYPRNQTIHELFEAQVARTPDAVALVFQNEQLTYHELNERANQLAYHLQTLGVGPEVLVGLFLERSLEMVIGLLGILKAGGAYVPMDPVYPQERIAFMLADAGATVILTQQSLAERLPATQGKQVFLDAGWPQIARQFTANPEVPVQPHHLAYVIYTSGSTGQPKGSLISHYNVVRLFQATQDWFQFNQNDVWTLFHSCAFDFSVWEIWGALLYGGRLVVVPFNISRSPEAFHHLLREVGVTVLNQTPAAFRQLIQIETADEQTELRDGLALRLVIFGGEALDFQSLKPWFDRHGDQKPQLVNMYGITETTVHVTYRPIKAADLAGGSVIGQPIPDLQIYLLDPQQQPVPVGVAGEIYVSGAGVGRGYLNRPELTAQKFIADTFAPQSGKILYRSGDLGRFLANGDLEYLGRIDHQVKIRGFRIELGEIEAVLNGHPAIRECVVVARTEVGDTKTLAAYLVVRAEPAVTVAELRKFLLAKLPDYMVPGAFVVLEKLPLTPNGKVDRKALPAPDENRLASGVEQVAPSTPTEMALAQIWSELLGLKQVSIHDNFFALGGHSLLAVRMAFRIHDALQVEVPVRQIAESPTIAALSRVVEASGKSADSSSTLRPKLRSRNRAATTAKFPVSFNQQQLWLIDQLAPDGSAYNLPFTLRLKGHLNQEALHRSLNHLLGRHEVLRTTFQAEHGELFQIIAPRLTIELPMTDLKKCPQAERETEAQRRMQNEAGRSFDLRTGPLVRAHLLRWNDEDHILLLTIHHIVFDGWSVEVLLRELAVSYAAYDTNRTPELPIQPVQYADYALWQRDYLTPEVIEQHLADWRQQLDGVPTNLDLPIDRMPAAIQKNRVATQPFKLAPELTADLRQLGQQQDTTLFVVLLTAFHTLLHRYTRQEQILIGSPFAGRSSGEVENLVGFIVNSLPVKADFSENPSFLELLRQVQNTVWEVQAHQDLPFEKLVQELQPAREANRNPFFQACIILETMPLKPFHMAGLTVEFKELVPPEAMFDLTLSLMDEGSELDCELRFNTDLYDAATIERLAENFKTLLAGIVVAPKKRVSDIPLLSAAERRQLLVGWNETAVEYARDQTIHELFDAQVAKTPDAIALVFEDRQLTYRELNERANQLAHHLQTLGVKPDTLVGVFVERSLEMVIGLLGILKAGGAYVPMDPVYPQERLAFMLADAQAAVILTQQSLVEHLPATQGKQVCLDGGWPQIARQPVANPESRVRPHNLAYVIYTSGSTGQPKGVQIEHRALVNFLHSMQRQPGLKPADILLAVTTLSFDIAGLEMFLPLISGARVVIAKAETLMDGAALSSRIQHCGATFMQATPATWRLLLEAGWSGQTGLTILCGGEAWSVALANQLLPRCQSLWNMYGPTETTIWSTAQEIKYGQPVLIGRPIANTQLYILDQQLQPVPVGVAGELHIGGDGLARGYLNRPELTAEKFIAHPFSNEPGARLYKTGDLCRYLPDGNIEYLGRIDHQVKIRGFRIELGEIEAVLGSHPAVRESVVVARMDASGTKMLAAYLVVQAKSASTVAELREFLLAKLPDYMVPAAFVVLEKLPLTPNGKVDRKALPAPDESRLASGVEHVAPGTPTETALAKIWGELIGLKQVGIHDNFFALGGHSLLVVRMAFRIHDALQVEVPVRQIAESPTIAALSRFVDEDGRTKLVKLGVRPRSGTETNQIPVALNQEQLWFIDQLEPGSSVYNLPMVLRLRGVLKPAALQQSLNHLVKRHEVLRTTFRAVDGVPFQIIAPQLTLELLVTDLESFPPTGRETEAQRRMQAEAGRSFDLKTGPLIRAELLRLDAEDHVLLVTVHHIVFDGWSMDVLLRELAAGYAAFTKGLIPDLPNLPVQYADYALWQRAQLTTEVVEQQLGYWRQQLAGVPTTLELPADHSHAAVEHNHGAEHTFKLPAEATTKLRQLGQQQDTTLFVVLLTAFQVLLHRYSRQEQILIGVPFAGRTGSEVENLIGFFVNTLPVKADLAANLGFTELLRQVREAVWAAQAHQELPFAELVRELQPVREKNRNPLFQVCVVHDVPLPETTPLSGLTMELKMAEPPKAKFELTLLVTERTDGLECALHYHAGLFEAATVTGLMANYQTLLAGIVAHPQERIAQLALMSESERRQLLEGWNETAVEYPQDQTIHELFEMQAARTPEAVALVFQDEQLTYRELNERANRVARHLQTLGVGPEVLVGLFLERSLEMVVGLLGILKAGGAYVPLDPVYPPERLTFMLADAQATVVLTQQPLVERLSATSGKRVCLDASWPQIARQPAVNLNVQVQPHHLAYVIYTSGSTGQPKGVAIEHQAIVNHMIWMLATFRFSKHDRVLQKTAFSFDASVWEFYAPLLVGGRLVLAQPGGQTDAAYLSNTIQQHQITVLQGGPSLLQLLLETPEFKSCHSLRCVFSGGEKLPGNLARQFYKILNADLHNLYGPTEATIDAAFFSVPSDNLKESIPIGRPIANTQIYLLDAHLQPVPVGVAGELHIGGVGLARGYLNRPELTAEKFIAHPFSNEPGARLYKTGDLCRYLPDGNIEYLGRIDHQVKIRGFRIELGEIEAVLGSHPAVRESVVVARMDASGTKMLAAYLVVQAKSASTVAELREFLLAKLPDYMVPAAFVVLEKLPLTPNGKVDRKALPAPDESRLASGVEHVAPGTPTETALAKIWGELIGLKQVGIHDNFFALGGHSLLVVRMAFRIHDALQVEVPVRQIAESPTIAALSRFVDEDGRTKLVKLGVRPRSGTETNQIPVALNQEQLWFIDQLEPGSSVYNLPMVLRLRGVLKPAALQQSLNHLVKRHEVLRTTFRAVDGVPFQIIAPQLTLELLVTDLESFPPTGRETEAQRRMQAEAGRSFDLKTGPLIRAELLRLDAEDHVLLVTVHHIVFDGWSMDVLLRELAAGYAAFTKGLIPDLPNLPVQYADYALWQRAQLQGEILTEQLVFWKQRLSGALPVLELPSDYPRPAVQTYCGSQVTLILPKALGDRLQKLSRQEEATLFMTVLTAFNILLHRYTSQTDIIVGSPSVNRNRPEVENLIGFFINMLVLRTDLSSSPSFRELLRRVRQTCREAYAHQDVPFEKLVRELQPERRLDRNPLFQVMLNLLDLPERDYDFPGLQVESVTEHEVQSKFDLTLYVTPTSQGIRFNLVYNSDLFAPARMTEMLAQFQQLLEQIMNQPDEKISRFSLVTSAAKLNLPDPAQPLDSNWMESVPARFSAMAQRTPQRVAVADPNDQWTYQELETRSNQLAHCLGAQNVNPSDIVAIYGHRSASLIWAMLGVWKAGAVFLILDPAHPPARLLECVQAAKPKAWLQLTAAGSLPEGLVKFAAGLSCRLELPSQSAALAQNFLQEQPVTPPEICIGPDDLAYIAFTSGSTGSPKGILGSHRPLSHFFQWQSEQFGLTSDDRFSMLSGLSHDPLLRDVFTSLWLGATVCIPEPTPVWEPERLKAWLKAERISVMHLAPALGQLLTESANEEMLPALRHLFFGGDVLRRSLITKLQNQAPAATLVNFYGTTETPQGVGHYILPSENAGKSHDPQTDQREIIPVGKGIRDVQLLVLNADDKLAGIGELGEICVRTPYLSKGYLDNDALTRKQFPINPCTGNQNDRYYKTGDLGRYLPDGNVELFGRNDTQMKIRGYRIELGEIEIALATHPLIANVVVTARQDAGGDKNLAAYLVARDEATPTPTELRTFLLQRLPDYMVPSAFVTLEQLPLTPNGKIDRQALPVPAAHRIVLENEFTASRTPTETALAKIWRELLGVEQIGVHENFFAAGGHSLLAVRLVNQIKQQMQFDLPMRTLFQHPTIHELAQILPAQKTQGHHPELIQLQPGKAGPEVFFLIDEGSLGLFKLAHFLGKDRRLFASMVPLPEATLRASAKKQFSALPRMEDMAAEHVALIRKHQPTEPVLLVGHCFGGALAFEVAHQLQAAGIQVTAVLLLDTWMAHPTFWWEKRAWLREHLGNLMRHGPGYLWRKSRRRISLEKDELASRLKLARHDNFSVYVPLTIITRIYRHAMRGYQLKPLAVRGILLLSQDDWLANAYRPIENSLGAGQFFTGGVTVIDVPGNHVTILNEEHLPELAEKLNQCLEQFRSP